MSNLDLSNKNLYDMLADSRVHEKVPGMEQLTDEQPIDEQPLSEIITPVASQPVKKRFRIIRSFKTFIIFVLVVALIAAFIYFTVYRLGWGVKECMNKNYHDCAALLTPELAPLAATGLVAML